MVEKLVIDEVKESGGCKSGGHLHYIEIFYASHFISTKFIFNPANHVPPTDITRHVHIPAVILGLCFSC